MTKKSKILMILISLIGAIFTMLGLTQSAVAKVDQKGSDILKKVLLLGMPTCYGSGNRYIKEYIDGVNGTVGFDQIFTDDGKKEKEDTILVPSLGLQNSLTQDIPAVSCKQVFEGYGSALNLGQNSIKGLFDLYGKTFEISQMGFEPEGGTGKVETIKKKCLKADYGYNGQAKIGSTNSICFAVEGDNDKVQYLSKDKMMNYETRNDRTEGSNIVGNLYFSDPRDNDVYFEVVFNGAPGCGSMFESQEQCFGDYKGKINCNQITDKANTTFGQVSECLGKINGTALYPNNAAQGNSEPVYPTVASFEEEGTVGGAGTNWKKKSNAAADVLSYIDGKTNFGDITFSEQEKYDILEYYVKKMMDLHSELTIDTDTCYENVSDLGSDYGVLNGGKWCKISGWEDITERFNVVRDKRSGDMQALIEVSFKEVLRRMKNIDTSKMSNLNGGLDVGDIDDDENICFANSGALGWIICPVITGISGVGSYMWDQIEKNFLQLPAEELFKGEGSLASAWGIFRDIANVVFVIFFLVVIFSQLTGVGIDNYGIKKVLPKLIVVAILVNLSFLLCALAVDLSNVLGVGLNKMFTELAVPISKNVTVVAPTATASLAVVGIGGGALVLFSILSNPIAGFTLAGVAVAVGLAVLGIVITVVVSMFFLYLILMVRDAGVVMLIAIAPVAIVCYLLPNTEKLFKKWVDLLKAVLLVYPICGLMIGAGKFAGNLLASIGGEGMAIAGMVIEVLPFFLIPMLLKRSLALMGNIGAKLSATGRSVGQKASRTTKGAITGSERFKNFSEFERRTGGARRAQGLQRRLERKKTRYGRLSERENEKLLKATETVNAYEQRRAQGQFGAYKLDRETAERRAEASLNAQEQKAALEEFAGMNDVDFAAQVASVSGPNSWYKTGDRAAEQRMAALLQTMGNRGMESQVFDVLRNNNVSGSSAVMQTLAGSKNYMMQAYGKKGGGKDFTTFETDGTLQKYVRDNDIKNADKDSLAEINAHASQTTTIDPNTNAPVVSDTVSQDMVMDAAVNTQTPKVRAQMNDMITNKIANSNNLAADLARFNLRGDSFRTMNRDTAQAMLDGTINSIMNNGGVTNRATAESYARNILHNTFTNQINEARANNQISSRISHEPGSVGDIFGI